MERGGGQGAERSGAEQLGAGGATRPSLSAQVSGAGSRLGLAAGREREGRPASFPPAVPPPRPREAAPGRAPPAGGGSRGAASIVLRRSSGAPPRGGGSAARGLTGPGPSRRAGAALWANKARRPAPAASAALPGAEGPRWLRARRPVRAWRRRRCRGGSRGAGGAGFCRCPSRLYVPSCCFPSVCALISRCLLFSPFSSLLYFFGFFFFLPFCFVFGFPSFLSFSLCIIATRGPTMWTHTFLSAVGVRSHSFVVGL